MALIHDMYFEQDETSTTSRSLLVFRRRLQFRPQALACSRSDPGFYAAPWAESVVKAWKNIWHDTLQTSCAWTPRMLPRQRQGATKGSCLPQSSTEARSRSAFSAIGHEVMTIFGKKGGRASARSTYLCITI